MLRAIVLGAVQGLTEFIPISSSGHLVLVPYVLGWGVERPIPAVPTLAFDVAIHVGTLVALIAYFWRDLVGLLTGTFRSLRGSRAEGDRANARLLVMLAVASLPAAVAGLAFKDFFEATFENAEWTAVQLLGTAAILVGADWAHDRREHHRDYVAIGVTDALAMGLGQAFSILPGISRSGATIAAGVARGLGREAAARFSFLLAIPGIFGAALITLPDLEGIPSWGPVLAGTVVAGVIGFASIAFLLRYLRTNRLRPFAVYCVVFGLAALAYWAQVK